MKDNFMASYLYVIGIDLEYYNMAMATNICRVWIGSPLV